MLAELLYPFQHGDTPIDLAAREGHTTCVERLLSTPVIDVNIKDKVSGFTLYITNCLTHVGDKMDGVLMFESGIKFITIYSIGTLN